MAIVLMDRGVDLAQTSPCRSVRNAPRGEPVMQVSKARHGPHARREPYVRVARPSDLHSIPSATGGIARLACARMREAGKGMAGVLSGAGLSAAQVADPA